MARTPKLDWELYKSQLLQLRSEGKSLTDVQKVLFEKTGVSITNARLSQIFTAWKNIDAVINSNAEVDKRMETDIAN